MVCARWGRWPWTRRGRRGGRRRRVGGGRKPLWLLQRGRGRRLSRRVLSPQGGDSRFVSAALPSGLTWSRRACSGLVRIRATQPPALAQRGGEATADLAAAG